MHSYKSQHLTQQKKSEILTVTHLKFHIYYTSNIDVKSVTWYWKTENPSWSNHESIVCSISSMGWNKFNYMLID